MKVWIAFEITDHESVVSVHSSHGGAEAAILSAESAYDAAGVIKELRPSFEVECYEVEP